jgi:integrase
MPKRSTLRLTTRSVAALPATGSDAFHWDRDLAGFGVRVQRNGRKVYVVQSRGPAGLKRVTLGPVAGKAIDERRREAAEAIDRIKCGLDPIPPKPEPDPTVADLAARCMRAYVKVHCKPKTQSLYRIAIDRHIVPALGAMAVKDVRSSDVIELHDRLRDTPSMANHVVAMLSKMFSLAQTWELVPHGRNPCRAVNRYREKPRERFLSPKEYRGVGAALRAAERGGWMWPPAVAAIRLLMLTGCRKSEILTLRWDDVDRTAGEFRLRDGKRGPRMVPLTTPALKVLDGIERVEGNPWVIRSRKPGIHLPDLTYYWNRIQAHAGLEGVRIHDLRHSHASRALALGESLTMIGRLLGHSKVGTTARYAHLVHDAEKAAAARTGDSIGAHLAPQHAGAA